jgi:transposase InsO family protein
MIRDAQATDPKLPVLRQKSPEQYEEILLAPDTLVWCYQEDITKPWKIYLPEALLDNAIRWYHLALGHIGSTRLLETMSLHFCNPELGSKVKAAKCETCAKEKNAGRGHGLLPAREASTHPWREIAVDMIGPWTLNVGGHSIEFRALTIIDTVTNLVELVRADNKRSETVARLFNNTWLSRYPRPMKVIHDQGTEFTGYAFQKVLSDHGIRPVSITTKNPQANAICERMHQTIGNTLRTMSTFNPPDGIETANQMLDTALANCMFATRAALHGSLKATPGSLVFSRDMILDIPLVADWLFIQENRQQLIDQRLIAANRKRFSYDYKVGEKVWKKIYEPHKLQSRFEGPYEITQVHSNGTLTIRLNATTIERISLRRVKPCDTE